VIEVKRYEMRERRGEKEKEKEKRLPDKLERTKCTFSGHRLANSAI
jgi:hypothetical protein